MTNQDQQLFGHPKGLFYLFFAELWERFSYYGMRALLMLYMVNEFFTYITDDAYREEVSFGIFAAYGSLVYATPVLGGMIADKFIGFKKSIIKSGAQKIIYPIKIMKGLRKGTFTYVFFILSHILDILL